MAASRKISYLSKMSNHMYAQSTVADVRLHHPHPLLISNNHYFHTKQCPSVESRFSHPIIDSLSRNVLLLIPEKPYH